MSRMHQVSWPPWGHHCFSFPPNQICILLTGMLYFGRISVTFVDKDGEEKHIKVPIGMSMLEAAHENDIELEGKDSDAYLVQSFAPFT